MTLSGKAAGTGLCPECGCALAEVRKVSAPEGYVWGKCICTCKHGARDALYQIKVSAPGEKPICYFCSGIFQNDTSWDHQHEMIKVAEPEKKKDAVNHPKHYNSHPSGIECIDIVRHHNFNVGNSIKYLWRQGLKDGNSSVQDLKKAAWYIQDEINRLEKGTK